MVASRAETASRRVPWGVREILAGFLAVLATFLALVLATAGLLAMLDLSERGRTVLLLLANTALEVLAALIAFLIAVGWRGGSPADLGLRPLPPARLWWVPAFLAAAFAVVAGYTLLVEALGLRRLLPGEQVPPGLFDDAGTAALGAVMVVLVAPLAEELVFRGFVFGGLAPRMGTAWAAAVSGLAFGLAHGQPGLILPLAVVGMLLAYLYEKGGSLWLPVAAHAYNSVAFAVLAAAARSG